MCKTNNNPEEAIASTPADIALIQARASHEYSLSPIGQQAAKFDLMQRQAKMLATSTIVPDTYRDRIGNCFIALDIAERLGMPQLMVMQNLDIIKGKPSWSAKFQIAMVEASGRFTPFRYKFRSLGPVGKITFNDIVFDEASRRNTYVKREFDGSQIDNLECVVIANDVKTGELLEGDPVSIRMAILEGWYTKNGSKWPNMPHTMLRYRAAAFWCRVYAPGCTLGLLTTEEVEDSEREVVDIDYTEAAPAAPKAPATPAAPKAPAPDADARKEAMRQRRAAAPGTDKQPTLM